MPSGLSPLTLHSSIRGCGPAEHSQAPAWTPVSSSAPATLPRQHLAPPPWQPYPSQQRLQRLRTFTYACMERRQTVHVLKSMHAHSTGAKAAIFSPELRAGTGLCQARS